MTQMCSSMVVLCSRALLPLTFLLLAVFSHGANAEPSGPNFVVIMADEKKQQMRDYITNPPETLRKTALCTWKSKAKSQRSQVDSGQLTTFCYTTPAMSLEKAPVDL